MAKKMNCPECRAQIKNHLPNKVLDSYIEKFVENFAPSSFQVTRKMLLDDRKRKLDGRTPVSSVEVQRKNGARGNIKCIIISND